MAGVDRDTYVEGALRRYLARRDLVALQRGDHTDAMVNTSAPRLHVVTDDG